MSSELKKASVGPVFLGSIFLFLIFAVVVWIWFSMGGRKETFEEKRAAARLDRLMTTQHEAHQKLEGYSWVNKEKGIVQLPIERAEELVAVELKAKPVHASNVKLENPYPYGLQQAPPTILVSPTPAAPAAAGSPAPAASAAPAAPAKAAAPAPSTAPSAQPQATATPDAPAAPEPQAMPSVAPASPTPVTTAPEAAPSVSPAAATPAP